jgi:hypothetical protein
MEGIPHPPGPLSSRRGREGARKTVNVKVVEINTF